MPKKDVDFSEADFKKEVNKILKSMDVPLDPDGNYPEEVKELWPAIQSKLGKKLLAKNWRVWTTMWTNVIGPTYVSAAKEAAKYAGVKYKGEIGSFAKKYHRDHGLALCKTLTETDLQRVQDQIVDNWGIGEKAFEKKFQDDYIGSEARLKTIYRSEHARAISEGTLEVGQEVGHQYKQWWCAEDERSCEICMAHHEETVPMDEAFSGGYAIPQDSHPSCRCVLITLEESDLSDDQKARMASRDPISLDDLDPTFQNSPWKSNEAFRQVLNYKCPENSHGPGFSCGEEGSAKKSDIKSSNKDIHYIGFDVSLDFENISDKNSVFSDKIQQILKDEAYTIESLSGDERDVIKTYTLMGYSVNEYLYKHPQLTDQKYKGEIKTIETFDNIFKNNKLKNSIITFRGISKKTLNKDKYLYDALHVPGTEIKLNGYSSSSIMPFVAAQLANVDDGCILEMKLPKGSDALYIAKESTFPWEEEVLINRNTNIKIGSSRVERVMIEPGNFKDMEIISVELKPSTNIKRKQNSNDFLKAAVQSAFEIALKTDVSKIKFNANCPESEKVGSGPGSCGGKTLENPLYSSLSKKSQATMKKYKMKGELKKAKTSIMASLVKSTNDPKTSLENAKINASIFKGMTAEEADELTGDAAIEHTNWLMDKGPYYDIKQGISEPMLEDRDKLWELGWNVNGTYHPDIPKKSILDDAAAKIFTYKDEQGRFRKNAELIDAIEEYTGDLYDMYNKVSAGNLPQEFLNLTPEDQKELKDRIDNFAAALNTAELPEPVVTYRGIRETTLKRLEQLGASEIGSEFQVNYFQSTTLNYETTKSFMGKDSKGRSLRIQIKLPKGTPAAYVDGFSANNGEDEVLVNRNLKYRCVDVKETDATKTLVWEAIL